MRILPLIFLWFFAKGENYKLVIGHSNAPERAKAFEEQLREAGIKNEILTTCIGPVVGTHIGPNCLGIGYITK